MAKKRGNGEGSIYYSESLKRWVGQYTFDGRRKSIYGKTRTEVKDKLNRNLISIVDHKYIDKSNLTLLNLIDMMIDTQLKSNKITEATYKRNEYTRKIIVEQTNLSNMAIQKIKAETINSELLNLTKYSNSTISKISQMIKSAFDKAILLNITNLNPFSVKGMIEIPNSCKEDKKVEALTIEEQNLFIKELEKGYDVYSDILYLAIYTGMRIGEILALDHSNIDLKNNLIHIDKTLTRDKKANLIIGTSTKTYAGTRDIPITSLIADILYNALKRSCGTLFTANNKLIHPATINAHVKRICKNANIRVYTTKKKKHKEDEDSVNLKTSAVNTHMLRHTYATRCIESGMSAVVLSKLLGHTDIETTLNTYTSVFNKFKEDEIQKYLNYISQLH